LLGISQDNVVLAFVSFKILIEISTTFACHCFYIKVRLGCVVTINALSKSRKWCWWWALDWFSTL